MPISLSICLSISLFVCLSVCLSVCPSSVRLSVCIVPCASVSDVSQKRVPPAQRASIILLEYCTWCRIRIRADFSSSDEFQYRRSAGEHSQIASMSLAIKPSLSLSLPSNREAAVVAIVANNSVFEYRCRLRMRSSDLGRAFRDLYIFSGNIVAN